MFKVLDLSRDLPCFQACLAQTAALHQSLDLHIENLNLVMLFAELIAKGVMADNLGQGASVVESGDLLLEDMERGRRPHE